MRKIKISRNGISRLPRTVVVTMNPGNEPAVGEHVELLMTGDCCHDFRPHEYVVSGVAPHRGPNSERVAVTFARF